MIPPLPPPRGAGQDGGAASIRPRYEDITQDGRMQLTAMMPGIGAAVWAALLQKVPAIETFRAQGILPILSRLVMEGEERSVSVNTPIHYTGSFRFARQKDGERLFANMWMEATAPIASTLGPMPPADAPREVVGRIFAEHVITRPFAPAGQRRVTRLDAPGVPAIPEDEHVYENAEALVATATTGRGPLDEAGDMQFGMMHTDSNQHVNSLVYPRVFEERVVRKLMQDARIGAKAPMLLAREIELRWRKPFFAGERARIGMRVTEEAASSAAPAGITVIGAFCREDEAEKPSTALRMVFR